METNINLLFREIIPPCDYQHRNGFNNIPILVKLSAKEKEELETLLISELNDQENLEIDTLVVETLGYLKSNKALPILKLKLAKCKAAQIRLTIITSLYEIEQADGLVDLAFEIVTEIDNVEVPHYYYSLSSAFYCLLKLKSEKIKPFLEKYETHENIFISYNAKRVLDILKGN
jgi:HEAT repeat protein